MQETVEPRKISATLSALKIKEDLEKFRRLALEIYPCGSRVEKERLPHVLLIGLILIY